MENNLHDNTNSGQVVAGEQWAMMEQLQAISLTLVDLAEYLDTHTDDQFAIERHNTCTIEYQELMAAYEQAYGPLMLSAQNSASAQWLWAMQDFPWDYEL